MVTRNFQRLLQRHASVKISFASGSEYQNIESQKSFNSWEYIQGKDRVLLTKLTTAFAQSLVRELQDCGTFPGRKIRGSKRRYYKFFR